MAEEERVVIVDQDNRVVGEAPRARMRRDALPYRATYILVFNSIGKIYIQKRTMSKDIYPGYYDVAAGGVVLAGENYEESAERELNEELGISSVPLISHFDFHFQGHGNLVWGRVFSCVYDGAMVLQEEEVESGCFMSVDEVFAMSVMERFTPDGLLVLKRYLKDKNGTATDSEEIRG